MTASGKKAGQQEFITAVLPSLEMMMKYAHQIISLTRIRINGFDCDMVPLLALFIGSIFLAELSNMTFRLIYLKTLLLSIVSCCLFLLLPFQGQFLPPPSWSHFAGVPLISSSYSSRWLFNFGMTLSYCAPSLVWQGIKPYKSVSKLHVFLYV